MAKRILWRITNHEKPRYQLYQFGFNETNSCWLDGGWITLPYEEWIVKKDAHQEMYKHVAEHVKKQHYRDPATPVSKMTPEQKQAWEYYSGGMSLTVVIEKCHRLQEVKVGTAGDKVDESSIKWLRKNDYKVCKVTKDLEGNSVDQTIFGIPEDLLTEELNNLNYWKYLKK